MKTTTAQRFGSLGKSFVSPATAAAVIGAALLASDTSDTSETAWSPAAACLLPDVLPVAGTLLSYGGDRQLAAGGTVTHSGALSLGSNGLTAGAISMGVLDSTSTPVITLKTSSSVFGAEGLLFDRTFYGQRPKHGLTTRYSSASADICLWGGGTAVAATLNGLFFVGSNGLGFGHNGDALSQNPTSYLLSGGANILHQRNGLNAQAYELFETYTSATNYGSLCLKATSSGHQIGSARGASGNNRAVQLGHFDGAGAFTSALSIATNGTVTAGIVNASRLNSNQVYATAVINFADTRYMIEDATTGVTLCRGNATSLVQIGGTTSSFAGLKRVGAALAARLADDSADAAFTAAAITASGAVVPSTHNSIDIGYTGTRWRNIYCQSLIGSGTSSASSLEINGAAGAGSLYFYPGSATLTGVIVNPTNGVYRFMNGASTSGACLDFATDATVKLRNRGDSADAALTCGAITASGAVQETPTQSSLNPTTINIPSGKRMGWYNSTLSEFRDWVNIGGTLLKSAAYT